MALVNQKAKIFGDIAANRTLLEGYPKLPINPSFPSINNDSNPLNFLTDLLSSLVGMESIKEVIVEILTRNLPNIEHEIKKLLKKEINNLLSCKIDPSIPSYILHDGEGLILELNKIDFTNLLLTNPNTDIGDLLYDDVDAELNSTDFNTFLYYVIQSGGKHTWADCIDVEFIENGEINNVLKIKVKKSFSDSEKTLKDLNNTLIDSINILELTEIFTKLVDNVFGVVSNVQGKSKDQILGEMKLDSIIESIMNQEDDEVIDNSFFEFDNKELRDLELAADNRQKGVKVVDISNKYDISTSLGSLTAFRKDIKGGESKDFATILNDSLKNIEDEITDKIPEVDKYSVNLDFISDLLKNLLKVIGSAIISPKIISILAINHQIVYGEKFYDLTDFIMKNKYFIKTIFNGIRDVVMDELLDRVMKEIQSLVIRTTAQIHSEQIKNTSAIINSLVGVPLDVTRQISGIN